MKAASALVVEASMALSWPDGSFFFNLCGCHRGKSLGQTNKRPDLERFDLPSIYGGLSNKEKKRKAVIQSVQKVWNIPKVINQSLVRLTFGLPTLAKPKFHLTFLTLHKVLKPAWTPCSIREGKRVLQRSSSSQKKGNFLLNLAVTAALHISSSKATF